MKKTVATAIMLICLSTLTPLQARTFQAEGSDAGAGVGARYIALGGAAVAISNDVYAAYSNPAGLAELAGAEVSVTRQHNAQLHAVNFVGVAARLPLEANWGVKASVAGVYYPRMHAKATGAFREDEIESIFLRYLLPSLIGTFDGELESKTKVYRLAFGLGSAESDRWSVGFNLDRIDCRTYFCGVHATSNGYTTNSAGATATSFGVGVKYRPLPQMTLAAAVSDVNSKLDVDVTITDNAGTRSNSYQVAFPMKTLLGAAYRFSPSLLTTGDYEMLRGRYGSSEFDFQVLRLGAEVRHSDAIVSRYGVLVPMVIRSSQIQERAMPFPFAPTIGGGYQGRSFKADLAIYAHPVMSLHKGGVAPTADLSVTLDF